MWSAITVTVALLDERRPTRTYAEAAYQGAEPAYQAGFIAGFDAANANREPVRAHAGQQGRKT
ncbi:hypothetical protein ACQEU6_09000 [Spirillospora sp. CA-108201]